MARGQRTEENTAAATTNTYARDLRSFCGWLVKSKRLTTSPVVGIEFLNEQKDRRRIRRALKIEVFRLFLACTEKQPEILGLSGYERMLLYWLAAETGLRWTELKSLTPLSFEITEVTTRPFVRILAKDAKNGEDGEQPITPRLAVRLRAYLSDREQTAPAFPMPADRRGGRIIERDLAAAGVPYIDERGRYFDFHSLRGMCATLLALANTPLTLAQRILRHSTPILTANFYTMYELEQKSEALAKVPSLDPDVQVDVTGAANIGDASVTKTATTENDDTFPDIAAFALAVMPPDAMLAG